MKIDQKHIDHVNQSIAAIRDKNDFISLINEVIKILYGENCNSVRLNELTFYANYNLCQNRYTQFTIKKKSGEKRIINAPVSGFKSILKSLNFIFQCIYVPHISAFGFVLNKSIVDNAKIHVGYNYVYNIDLKDFFHSFRRKKVERGLFYFLRLRDEQLFLNELLTYLSVHPISIGYEKIVALPQGSPVSPILSNILCKKLDNRLAGLARSFGVNYSRYADDITFSSNHNIYKNELFLNILHKILFKYNFTINADKTRLQKSAYRQEVTGLVVNKKINVRKRFIKQIRMWLYYWERYGFEKAQQIFIYDYLSDKKHTKNGVPNIVNVLGGKIEFVKMVKGSEDATYIALRKRLDKLKKNMQVKY